MCIRAGLQAECSVAHCDPMRVVVGAHVFARCEPLGSSEDQGETVLDAFKHKLPLNLGKVFKIRLVAVTVR